MANSSAAQSQPKLPALLGKVIAKSSLRGETVGKSFAAPRLGAVIERAIALSGMTKQQAADAMGYAGPATLSRWIQNQEPGSLERLWSVVELRPWLLIALSEDAGEAVAVDHTVRVRRTA